MTRNRAMGNMKFVTPGVPSPAGAASALGRGAFPQCRAPRVGVTIRRLRR